MATNSKVEGIIDALRDRIIAGEFGVEGRLPSFRTLATEYDTTQETMNKTMQALQAEGLLVSMGAKGVFVSPTRIKFPGMVANFYGDFLKNERDPFELLIEKPKIIKAIPELAKKLNLPKNAPIIQRIRKQGAGNLTFRFVYEYFPMSFINEKLLEKIYTDPHLNIVLEIKETLGKTIKYTHEELLARLPTTHEQKELQIVRTNPIIDIDTTQFTDDKKTVVTYNKKILNANYFLLIYDYSSRYWDK